MSRYEFRGPDLELRVIDPAIEGGVGVRIEHASGAALLVRSVEPARTQEGLHVTITGFDGSRFSVHIDPAWQTAQVTSDRPTPILGGADAAVARRDEAAEKREGTVRVTGDETTMPITVDDE